MGGWHGYNGRTSRRGRSRTGALKTVGTEGNYGSDLRADLATDREFTNFEISVDWKATRGGNSGLMYGVVEDKKYDARGRRVPSISSSTTWASRRSSRRGSSPAPTTRCTSPHEKKRLSRWGSGTTRGSWSTASMSSTGSTGEDPRVRALDGRVEEAPRLRKVEGSADYGLAKTGRIVLQDHGSVFWFRNLKVRPLP